MDGCVAICNLVKGKMGERRMEAVSLCGKGRRGERGGYWECGEKPERVGDCVYREGEKIGE